MKKLFKKPKYMVYMFLVLVCSFWFLHLIFAPDINVKTLGYVKNGERVHCSGFDIPSGTTKVKVGWSSAYVTTVAKGKMSMASASQTVTLK